MIKLKLLHIIQVLWSKKKERKNRNIKHKIILDQRKSKWPQKNEKAILGFIVNALYLGMDDWRQAEK